MEQKNKMKYIFLLLIFTISTAKAQRIGESKQQVREKLRTVRVIEKGEKMSYKNLTVPGLYMEETFTFDKNRLVGSMVEVFGVDYDGVINIYTKRLAILNKDYVTKKIVWRDGFQEKKITSENLEYYLKNGEVDVHVFEMERPIFRGMLLSKRGSDMYLLLTRCHYLYDLDKIIYE